MKRVVDIVVSAIALILFSPILAVVALQVRFRLGAPIFFTQQRIGKNGREFRMIKFRTMKNAIDAHGNPLPDEQRMTAFGNLLRKTSLDELPELINVFTGDMSLVGPRPLLPQYLKLYTPFQNRRHEVRPGITGWAQVNGRNSLSWEDRFALDVWYVDHRSVWLDLKILVMTVGKVLFPKDISHDGHATMPEFSYASSSRIAVIGAGGHARVVIDTLQSAGHFVSEVYDDNSQRWGESLNGIPVTGPISKLNEMAGHPAIIAIENNTIRANLAEELNCTWVNAIHPSAVIAQTVKLGRGILVAAGVVIQDSAEIGDHVIINTSASVDQDCIIDNGVHLCSRVCLPANVSIGRETILGPSSTCLSGIQIGIQSRVGAGAIVINDLKAGSSAIGIPAKIGPTSEQDNSASRDAA